MVISYDEQNHWARKIFKTTTIVISYDEQNHWARKILILLLARKTIILLLW